MERKWLLPVNDWLFRDKWNIGIANEPISSFLEDKPNVRWLPPSGQGKFFADPFALNKNDNICILCEEYDYNSSRGRIVSLELNDFDHSPMYRVAMQSSVHMSYPYIIESRGDIYCIPETYQAREVSIYKAEKFPTVWTRVAVMIDNFAGVDPTVFRFDGRWWLACTNHDDHGSSNTLFVWYADGITGPWIAHTANPVKIDARSSRPAGTPFQHDGELFRPAQDCTSTYGGKIVLNRVTSLTPTVFREEHVQTITPYGDGPYPDGIHTISAAGDYTIIDGKRMGFIRSLLKKR